MMTRGSRQRLVVGVACVALGLALLHVRPAQCAAPIEKSHALAPLKYPVDAPILGEPDTPWGRTRPMSEARSEATAADLHAPFWPSRTVPADWRWFSWLFSASPLIGQRSAMP